MRRYILDTHILVWFLEKDKRLPDNIREDIEYMQYQYYVSFLSLLEIDNLRKLGKIHLKHGFKSIMSQLFASNIDVCFGSSQDFAVLDDIEMKTIDKRTHGDYIDRMIIATAIAKHYTCISADAKFRHYRKNGLQLLEV